MDLLNIHADIAPGGIDPWKELSVVQGRNGEEAQIVLIEDTAHCADMMSKRATDRESLKRARQVCIPSVTFYFGTHES